MIFRLKLSRQFASQQELHSLIKSVDRVLKVDDVQKIGFLRLHMFDEQYKEINEKMSSGQIAGNQLARAKGKIDLLTNQSRVFNQLKCIFEDAYEASDMLEESKNDKESVAMLREEISSLQLQLDSLNPALVENILEPEEFDDCDTAVVEFRPGKNFAF